jgi:Kef-type K+ transport system membrane component KefB
VWCLLFVIVDAGVNSDAELLRRHFWRSVLIAVVGVIAPIAIGLVFFHVILGFSLIAGAVGGVALSSTSVGTSIRILADCGVANTPVGVHLLSAAMFDDVLSLLALSVVLAVGSASAVVGDDRSKLGLAAAMPVVTAVVLMIGIVALHRFALPALMRAITRSLGMPNAMTLQGFDCTQQRATGHDGWLSKVSPLTVGWWLLFTFAAFTVAVIVCCWFVGGSPFVAAFACGVSFGDTLRGLWNDRVGAHVRLFQGIFFLAVGASLPVTVLFSSSELLYGFVYSLLSLLSKAVCGFAYHPHFWTVALAMISRGDLGFLMLSSAASLGLIDASLSAIAVWALVTNTLLGPLLLAWHVRRQTRLRAIEIFGRAAATATDGFESASDSDGFESCSDDGSERRTKA